MKGLAFVLAVALFACSFLVCVPSAQAGGLFFRRQTIVVRQPFVRQRVIVQQQFVSPAIVFPRQQVIIQQPPLILVPQAFSSQSFFAY